MIPESVKTAVSGKKTYLSAGALVLTGILMLTGNLALSEEQQAAVQLVGTGAIAVALRLAVAKLGLGTVEEAKEKIGL